MPGIAHHRGSARKKGKEPATLYRVMQDSIGRGLRDRYEPPQKISHELLVLLMQLNEQEPKAKAG